MSVHNPCTCPGTRTEKMKNWYIVDRNINHSYFEAPKGGPHFSNYSTVHCKKCSMYIRSKANYVFRLGGG